MLRRLSVLLLFFIFLAFLVSGFSGSGSGTTGDPFQITSWAQLNEMRDNRTAHYILMNDLNSLTTGYSTYAGPTANTNTGWLPVGDVTTVFTGTLNGNSHVISDIVISRASDRQGLFGIIGSTAEIHRLGIENISITSATYYVGALAGQSHETAITNQTYSTGTINVVGLNNRGLVAGLMGASRGQIYDSYSLVDVTAAAGAAGGFGGEFAIVSGFADNVYSNGSVTAPQYEGGLYSNVNIAGTVNNSFWDNQTSGTSVSGAGTGKTTAQMKNILTFNDTSTAGLDTAWDIVLKDDWVNEIWFIDDGNDYPKLGWQFIAPVDTCTCAGAGNDWEIDMSDYCNITTACDLTTGTLSFTGAGWCNCNASVDTTNLGDPGANGILYIQDSCLITID